MFFREQPRELLGERALCELVCILVKVVAYIARPRERLFELFRVFFSAWRFPSLARWFSLSYHKE